MQPFIREFFTFSRQNKNALLVLFVVLILCIAAIPVATSIVRPSSADYSNHEALRLQLDSLWALDSLDPPALAELAYFDPNTLTEAEWRSMGIEDRVVRNIMNYKAKGGRFYRKEDVLRIYSFTKEDYLRLASYIRIGHDRHPPHYGRSEPWPASRTSSNAVLDINVADSAAWTQLRGIGPVLASRIVKYRSKVGSFNSLEQIKNVYGLSSETFEEILPHLRLDTGFVPQALLPSELPATVVPVELNIADSAALDALPGLGAYGAGSIVKYRRQLGGFTAMTQLQEVGGLRPENIEKFSAHLTLDTSYIVKINLNQWTHSQLEAHPYISRSLADFITTYRSRTPFQGITELRKSFLVDGNLYRKLRPYLTI